MGSAIEADMTTFADIRRKHGPSQQAFAQLCELTQPQVSQYERGAPGVTDEVIERISQKSGETIATIRNALQRSVDIAADPVTKQIAALERLVKDMYVRHDESGRLNLGATMGAFGEGCFRLTQMVDRNHLDWPRLAGIAREHRLRIEAQPRTAAWATSYGALLAAEGMAGSLASPHLLADAWPELVEQIEPVLKHGEGNAQIERYVLDLGLTMLPAALRDSSGYLKSAEHLADVWTDYAFAFAERGQAPPLAQQQIAGVVSLSSGLSDAVLESAPIAERDLVASSWR
jgi:transcriptional regulator with XRE-family HTH domain